MNCIILILRSLRSGERIGLWPSEDGGVYVKVSSLSFLQPLAAEFARDVKEGIFLEEITLPSLFLLLLSGWNGIDFHKENWDAGFDGRWVVFLLFPWLLNWGCVGVCTCGRA